MKLKKSLLFAERILLSMACAVGLSVSGFAYNRTASVNYAWDHVFSPNPMFPVYANDCTSYVSQCCYWGGWPQVIGAPWSVASTDKWWRPGLYTNNGSYTWAGARFFEEFITRSGRGGLVSDWRQLRPGDIICADWGSGNAPGSRDGITDHLMIVLVNNGSDVWYAQHSPGKVRTLRSVQNEMWNARFWYYHLRD